VKACSKGTRRAPWAIDLCLIGYFNYGASYLTGQKDKFRA